MLLAMIHLLPLVATSLELRLQQQQLPHRRCNLSCFGAVIVGKSVVVVVGVSCSVVAVAVVADVVAAAAVVVVAVAAAAVVASAVDVVECVPG